MTRGETAQIVAGIHRLWPHSNLGGSPDAIVNTWHALLGQFSYDDVEKACFELAATGREFAPPPGLVVKTLAERAINTPDWDAAWTEIEQAVRKRGRDRRPANGYFSHPLIDAFAIPAWKELCAAPAPGTSAFGTHYAQQREAYGAMRARATRGVSLAALGAPRTEVLNQPFTPELVERLKELASAAEAAGLHARTEAAA